MAPSAETAVCKGAANRADRLGLKGGEGDRLTVKSGKPKKGC